MKKVPGAFLIALGLFFILQPVFTGQVVLPQSFHIASVTIHYYGLIIALAVMAAYWLASKRAPQYGISAKDLDRLLLVVVVTGFVGARLYHIVSDLGYYRYNVAEIWAVWNGGLSIFGVLG